MANAPDLRSWLGNIDIYLLDQVLRGRFSSGMRLLDAGCGSGRNLRWFLRSGYSVSAIDSSPEAVARVVALAQELSPHLPETHFRVGDLRRIPFADGSFDAVVCNAVLHFAEDEGHFAAMVEELWRVLAPGGLLFCRLASATGIEDRITPIEGRRYHLPDGSTRFLVDERMLLDWTARLGGRLLDPVKTVNVQGLRCMATWCLTRN